ncbi:MAG: nucleotide sugar dehydrogenase [Anaerolineae bacterium]|nr:nucleotide sugar dehydrogenase [Anaerolineae bacterium]
MTLAVSLANVGYKVLGVDTNLNILAAINEAKPHFHEVGLEPLLRYELAEGRFRAANELREAADVYIIAVGTPVTDKGEPILDSLRHAAEMVGRVLKRNEIVMIRSTVPVGSTREFILPILERESGLSGGRDFQIVFAPERTIEGRALQELRTLPQIIGGIDDYSEEMAVRVFNRLAPNTVRVNGLEAAEMVKLVNNSFRDVSFAFANELALICDAWGLDAFKVVEAANSGYPRNPVPLPSPGVGGICMAKDPFIYVSAGRAKGYEPILPIYGRQINTCMVDHVAGKVSDFFSRHHLSPAGRKVLVMGFAFKGEPETSDIRKSVTLDLLPLLKQMGAEVWGYDPAANVEEIAALGVNTVDRYSLETGFQNADAVLVMNNHSSYNRIDLFQLLSRLNRPGLFFDGWHMFSKHEVERIQGIEYIGISGAL